MNEEIKAEVDHAPNPPKHHQAPWIHSESHPTDIIDEKGDFLGRFLRSENAEFSARAVNAHDELVRALERAYACLNWLRKGNIPVLSADGQKVTSYDVAAEIGKLLQRMK